MTAIETFQFPATGQRAQFGDRRLPERFWAKTTSGAGGCWIWTGADDGYGYGSLSVGSRANGTKRAVRAYRYAYERIVGSVPEGLQLDHLCRVRRCVNPAHLEPVTRRVNLLRGMTITRANAEKTHCPRQHPYDSANTYVTKRGTRACRACSRLHQARRRMGGTAPLAAGPLDSPAGPRDDTPVSQPDRPGLTA